MSLSRFWSAEVPSGLVSCLIKDLRVDNPFWELWLGSIWCANGTAPHGGQSVVGAIVYVSFVHFMCCGGVDLDMKSGPSSQALSILR